MSNNAKAQTISREVRCPLLNGYDPSETIRRIPQMSKELAQLLGELFTDGCVSPKKKNSWRIYFAAKSQNLTDLFVKCMIKLFNLDASRIRLSCTSDGLWRAIINSKEIGNFLVDSFGTFRTLSFKNGKQTNAKLPKKELAKSKYLADFLKTAFSCDGGISFYPASRIGKYGGTKWLIRTVFLSCAHKKLRKDYKYLLNKLGITVRDVPKDGKIKIETKEDIKKFYQNIGFVKKTVITGHSKYWEGYEKQRVLELMINSYKNPSAIYNLSKFNRGNDIVRPS